MKTKFVVLSVLLSAGLVTSAFAAGRGNDNRGSCVPGTPVLDGSGRPVIHRGNPNGTGTPVRDGSGKSTAPGKGAKDGTGNRADCPNPPAS
jgi:hypothetical protein